MSMSEIQRVISEIAYEKWNNGETMTVSELREELRMRNLESGNGRGIYSQISSAYNHAIKEDNYGIADCIANCFTDDNGNFAWRK